MKVLLSYLDPGHPKFLFSKELNSNRVFGLDILRAYAIIIVIIGHGQFLLPKNISSLHKYINFDGVSVFFVLSGFLIGGILIKDLNENKLSFNILLNFWIRRWARTLPNYFLILTILTICYYFSDPLFSLGEIQKYYYFSQNLFREPTLKYFRESWSLSVEEWSYFTVPLLIFIFITIFKTSIQKSILITVLLILFSITYVRYNLYQIKDPLDFHHKVFFRLDSIMYGIIGSYINFYHKKYWKFKPKLFFILGLAIFVLQKYLFVKEIFPVQSFYNIVLCYSLTALGTLLLLPFLSGLKNAKYKKVGHIITIISIISYSMYLTHMSLVKDLIVKKIPWTDYTMNYNIILPINYSLYWILTITFSMFLYKFFELPTTKLRDKLKFKD